MKTQKGVPITVDSSGTIAMMPSSTLGFACPQPGQSIALRITERCCQHVTRPGRASRANHLESQKFEHTAALVALPCVRRSNRPHHATFMSRVIEVLVRRRESANYSCAPLYALVPL